MKGKMKITKSWNNRINKCVRAMQYQGNGAQTHMEIANGKMIDDPDNTKGKFIITCEGLNSIVKKDLASAIATAMAWNTMNSKNIWVETNGKRQRVVQDAL